MQTSAFRVEVIRFSLLVTLTVALLSVAIRLASHSDSHSTLRPGALPSGSTAPSSTATSPPSTATPLSPRATTTPSPLPSATDATGSGAGGDGGSGGGGSGGPSAQPVLPVTGDDAVKLIAVSMLLIGAGAQALRASRR